MSQKIESKLLHEWFLQNQRSFPWREERSFYRVWISEIMLQQTRASVVVKYFERWMKKFPDIFSLANAPKEEVIKAWEGLGYYSRARAIHATAKEIVETYKGKVEPDRRILQKFKGFGPYTIEAVLAFAFHKRATPVDGNVRRVLARLFAYRKHVTKAQGQAWCKKKFASLLDNLKPWITAEAMIELGALVCTKANPRCENCPFLSVCKANKKKCTEELPILPRRSKTILLQKVVFIFEHKGKVLMKKNCEKKLFADLYAFPEKNVQSSLQTVQDEKEVLKSFGFEGKWLKNYQKQEQNFTRYKVTLFPILFFVTKIFAPIDGYEWIDLEEINKIPLTSGHRKIFIALDKRTSDKKNPS